ncbi:MAG: sigma-70 family RNA polymerase sigma factor [Coriobacteriales bacterium]|nr:sigma-70 family RNA polymerase sigma factor [Coriobacteriales bacterium]
MQCDLEQVVREHGDMVLRIARSNVGNKADAEDIFQEVFIRLVRSIDKINDEEHLRYWLIRATTNRCKSLFASAQKRNELAVEQLPETASMSESPFDEPDTPATDALQKLPEKYRTAIYLFYFEDRSVKEIAKVLESSEGTVKSQLSRGRKMLKETLEKVQDV